MSAPQQPSEPRAARRRWLSVGELIAVAGLIIAGLSLYLGWSDRRSDEERRAAAEAAARRSDAQTRGRVGLIATDADGEVLSFKGAACALQSADISFPSALGVETQNTVLEHRIDADWFDGPLLEAIGPDVSEGRLPVLIESRCTGEAGDRLESAIYEVPYRIESRLLRGRAVLLRGLVLRSYVGQAQGQAQLDAAWKAVAG